MQGGMSELSNGFVVLMGLATVFIGLICIILLIMIVSALCRISSSVAPQSQAKDTAPASVTPVAPVAQATAGQIERGELVAVVSAAIAEELGTDVSVHPYRFLTEAIIPFPRKTRISFFPHRTKVRPTSFNPGHAPLSNSNGRTDNKRN